ncbi:MAG: hypothetical protein K1X78_07885 [Verrucomicrobiaceae bacterium]|nr:hypothetical protein [Verrucomicrobiaceae bacterium]
MIHQLLDTTKVVATTAIDSVPHEVCAEAMAAHDRATAMLTVRLRAFLRTLEHTHLGDTIAASWLPAPDTVTEHVSREEASEMAKDVFSSWCHRVERAVPQP